MTVERPRESYGSRRHRSTRRTSREQPQPEPETGIRMDQGRHDPEASQVPVASYKTAQSVTSHQTDEVQSTRRERRRTQRQRSHGSIPSPPIETPITSVLGDLRDDIEETVFSPQLSSTAYGEAGVGDNGLMRGRGMPHGPVYIENRSGFSQVSRERAFDGGDSRGRGAHLWGYWQQSERTAAPTENKPVHLAISIEACWSPLATFCHGVLAGLSLMQTIFVEVICSPSPSSSNVAEFAAVYGKLSQLFSSLIYILVSLCLVSVFDWMDISHADCRQLFDVLSSRPRITWLLVPLYGVALILTFLAARTDDWLASLASGSAASLNFSATPNVTDRLTDKTDLQMFEVWRIYNLVRCACVLLGWLIIATARPKDLLLQHLKAMLRPTAAAPLRLP